MIILFSGSGAQGFRIASPAYQEGSDGPYSLKATLTSLIQGMSAAPAPYVKNIERFHPINTHGVRL
jgi:hypothetical protein